MPVNLERAMSANTRFGGHYVQGHIDGTAVISKISEDADKSLRFTFTLSDKSRKYHLIRYIVEKGFITVDGTSLTVTGVENESHSFGIMMIEHTQEHSVVGKKKVGDVVNIEVDVNAKEMEKLILAHMYDSDSAISQLIKNVVHKEVADQLKSLRG